MSCAGSQARRLFSERRALSRVSITISTCFFPPFAWYRSASSLPCTPWRVWLYIARARRASREAADVIEGVFAAISSIPLFLCFQFFKPFDAMQTICTLPRYAFDAPSSIGRSTANVANASFRSSSDLTIDIDYCKPMLIPKERISLSVMILYVKTWLERNFPFSQGEKKGI